MKVDPRRSANCPSRDLRQDAAASWQTEVPLEHVPVGLAPPCAAVSRPRTLSPVWILIRRVPSCRAIPPLRRCLPVRISAWRASPRLPSDGNTSSSSSFEGSSDKESDAMAAVIWTTTTTTSRATMTKTFCPGTNACGCDGSYGTRRGLRRSAFSPAKRQVCLSREGPTPQQSTSSRSRATISPKAARRAEEDEEEEARGPRGRTPAEPAAAPQRNIQTPVRQGLFPGGLARNGKRRAE